jgi:hypothetical protein
MPVESLTCPNCGAPVQIDAEASAAECTFCGSTLRILEDQAHQKIAEVTSRPMRDGPGGVSRTGRPDFNEEPIRQLVLQGKKIEAIKLYRDQTGAGLKEAKDAVEAMQRQLPPTLRSRAPAQAGRFGLLGCLGILGIVGVCAVSIGLMSQVMFRAFGPLDQAMDLLRRNEQVVAALGEPINPGLFIFGEISSGSRSSHASLEVPLFGSRRNGTMNVSGTWERNQWDLSLWVYYDQGGEEVEVYLTSSR